LRGRERPAVIPASHLAGIIGHALVLLLTATHVEVTMRALSTLILAAVVVAL